MLQILIDFAAQFGLSQPFVIATLRLSLASFFGGLIGLEREMKGRPAGLKTFSLVCMGSALVMVTNEFVFVNTGFTGDSTRMAAQVISGIGFLGAGTIMTTGNNQIKGLTTAAALWVTAAIGIAVGTGFIGGATMGVVILYVSSLVCRYVDKVVMARAKLMTIYVEGENEEFMLELVDYFHNNDIRINTLTRKDENKWFLNDSAATIEMTLGKTKCRKDVMDDIRKMNLLRYVEEI